ncbi:MAG TPA: c-type cytochrome [Vicinamibacterales bacterium]|nr:c-type cytochrome [Vicinamibacterales bacterium]
MTRCTLALGVVLLTGSLASAQPPAAPPPARGTGAGQPAQPPAPLKNLQVFPKDTPREQVLATMQAFTQALGVNCNYCHVQDRAADDLRTKAAARQMMILARDINQKLPQAVNKPADQATRVGCVTCHRGVPIPKQLSDILLETEKDKGADAAVAQYWDLRKQFYGRAAYDFGDGTLITVAQRLTADKPDEALKFLEINTQFFPGSARTFQAMSAAHLKQNKKDEAIKDLEKAAALDPQNPGLKRQLDQLKGATQ